MSKPVNRKEIKKFLIDQEMTITQLARLAGVSFVYAQKTLAGKERSRAVVETLKALGCPSEYLGEE